MRKSKVFGLKSGQNLENRAAHPHQEFAGVLPGDRVYPRIHLNSQVSNLKSSCKKIDNKTGHPKDSTQSYTIKL